MNNLLTEDQKFKNVLEKSKIIAMVGVSSVKKDVNSKPIIRRPSIIVMQYLQEFGYKVIPVNPTAVGKTINGEIVYASLKDVPVPVDIVNVFRPSNETIDIAKQATDIKAKVLWLQLGIDNAEAKKISDSESIVYISNRCIKQEYQRLFLKVRPVFPALKRS
jgi:predicted CoA-binding protein